MIGSSSHLMRTGFKLFPLEEPIYIPSVFDEIIARPYSFLKTSRRIKGAHPESVSDKTAVVSSAYWRSLVSSSLICNAFYLYILMDC